MTTRHDRISRGKSLEDEDSSRQTARKRIQFLRKQLRRGGWGLGLFVLVSVFAIPNFPFLPRISDSVRTVLGEPPPVGWIHVALVIYVFSALTLTMARTVETVDKYRGFMQLFFISSFYVFYGFADGLAENYWAVFVSGLSIMGLENYLIRNYCKEAISREMETLEKKST